MTKGLRESKNYNSCQFLQDFLEKHWTRSGLDKLLRKISVTGSVDRVIGGGRRSSARTEENVAVAQWCQCLQACVQAEEGHFEHLF